MGVAISDPLQMTGRPLTVLSRRDIEGPATALVEMIQENDVCEVVVGMPTTLSGRPGEAARDAERVATSLEATLGVPVERWDERLTTAIAEASLIEANVSRRARKDKVDMVAAAVILQSYLDSRRTGSARG